MIPVLYITLLLVGIQIFFGLGTLTRTYSTKSIEGHSILGRAIMAGSVPGWIYIAFAGESTTLIWSYSTWAILLVPFLVLFHRYLPTRKEKYTSIALTLAVFIGLAIMGLLGHYFWNAHSVVGLTLSAIDLVGGVSFLRAGLSSPGTRGLSIVALVTTNVSALIHVIAGFGVGGLAAPGMIHIGFLAYGLIAIGYTTPVLVRVCYRRARGLDGGPKASYRTSFSCSLAGHGHGNAITYELVETVAVATGRSQELVPEPSMIFGRHESGAFAIEVKSSTMTTKIVGHDAEAALSDMPVHSSLDFIAHEAILPLECILQSISNRAKATKPLATTYLIISGG